MLTQLYQNFALHHTSSQGKVWFPDGDGAHYCHPWQEYSGSIFVSEESCGDFLESVPESVTTKSWVFHPLTMVLGRRYDEGVCREEYKFIPTDREYMFSVRSTNCQFHFWHATNYCRNCSSGGSFKSDKRLASVASCIHSRFMLVCLPNASKTQESHLSWVSHIPAQCIRTHSGGQSGEMAAKVVWSGGHEPCNKPTKPPHRRLPLLQPPTTMHTW